MIIKKLKLQNIRSYKEAIIDLPLGKTLFGGNIGCGKSTILMAIEFALFGLGSEKGASLLRAGEDGGSVSMIFECDGLEYTIRRELRKKRNSVQQTDKCVLNTPEGVTEYTPGELKEAILQILDFNEPPDPKAQSVIYRYAIYTPQEEMKAILTLRPDIRMQTLRKAFRIEDYKTAAEHAKSLNGEIKQRARLLQELSSDINQVRESMEEKANQIKTKNQELNYLGRKESENGQLLADLKAKRSESNQRQLALKESVGKAEGLEKLAQDKETERDEAIRQIEFLSRKIDDLKPKVAEREVIVDPTDKNLKELRDEIKQAEAKERGLREEKNLIEAKVSEYRSIIEEGICPTCDRPVVPQEFSKKMEQRNIELQMAEKSTSECVKFLEELRDFNEKKRIYEDSQILLAGYKQNLNEHSDNMELWKKKKSGAEEVIQKTRKQLVSIDADLQRLKQVSDELVKINAQIESAEREGRQISGEVSGAKQAIEFLGKQIRDLDVQAQKKNEQRARATVLNDYQIWIQDYFLPTLEIIEQQVMNRIREDFDAQFQKWFNMLVDDPGKDARIDEEFTPLIQQDGMDQEVAYLSGGEKTSIALAYRLALNNIVGKVAAGAKSNLLILDEPTDGFSKEQLGKVREILDEIKNPQVILVSHETELESFADQVIRVSKANGESRIDASTTRG